MDRRGGVISGSEKLDQTQTGVERLDTQVSSLHQHVATLSQEVTYMLMLL